MPFTVSDAFCPEQKRILVFVIKANIKQESCPTEPHQLWPEALALGVAPHSLHRMWAGSQAASCRVGLRSSETSFLRSHMGTTDLFATVCL